jgi:aryl-alcohol dehydrogenase-like predicted oxidoreductase
MLHDPLASDSGLRRCPLKLRNVGRSGLRVSAVGLGCNNFGGRIDLEASRAVVHKALDVGITLFDTADVYGGPGASETILGKLLGARRKEIVLATKFGTAMDEAGRLKGASRGYIMSAVEASLRRLQTDWIDLYHLHRPDPLTPIEETLRALDDLIRHGKVRYIACSNLPAWQVAVADGVGREQGLSRFICCQDEYSLLVRGIERELIPAIEHLGLGLLPYFPLTSGLLTGKYRRNEPPPAGTRYAVTGHRHTQRYLTDANWDKIENLTRFAEARGHALLELAMSWLAGRSVVSSVMAGATRPEQVEANVKAIGWELSADDLADVDRIAA